MQAYLYAAHHIHSGAFGGMTKDNALTACMASSKFGTTCLLALIKAAEQPTSAFGISNAEQELLPSTVAPEHQARSLYDSARCNLRSLKTAIGQTTNEGCPSTSTKASRPTRLEITSCATPYNVARTSLTKDSHCPPHHPPALPLVSRCRKSSIASLPFSLLRLRSRVVEICPEYETCLQHAAFCIERCARGASMKPADEVAPSDHLLQLQVRAAGVNDRRIEDH